MFGGDSSANFSRVMTEILNETLRKASLISQMQQEWDQQIEQRHAHLLGTGDIK